MAYWQSSVLATWAQVFVRRENREIHWLNVPPDEGPIRFCPDEVHPGDIDSSPVCKPTGGPQHKVHELSKHRRRQPLDVTKFRLIQAHGRLKPAMGLVFGATGTGVHRICIVLHFTFFAGFNSCPRPPNCGTAKSLPLLWLYQGVIAITGFSGFGAASASVIGNKRPHTQAT